MTNLDQTFILNAALKAMDYEIAAMERAKSRLSDGMVEAVRLIVSSSGRVVFSGMGKSGLIGKKISSTLSSTGTPSVFMHPAEALHGDLGMLTEQDVAVVLSNSGETGEIVTLFPYLRRVGVKVIAMTGNTQSSLAKMSDVVLDTSVEREACPLNLAPTSSTTVTLAIGDALACALIEAKGFKEKDFAKLHPSGSLGRRFISVKDLMHKGSEMPVVKPSKLLREAVVNMSTFGFGTLLVCDENQKLLGIFTDGDLRRYFQKSQSPALDIPISSVMVANPMRIKPEQLAMEALKLMEEKSVTALPVTQPDGTVCGFLHLHDILRSRLV